MRIGVISDIHGNIDALDAVLNEIKKYNVEKIFCLGDLIGGAAQSEEVVQRIMALKDKCICVRGNREKYIIEGMPLVVHDEKKKTSQEQLDRNEWIKNHLSQNSLDYINKMPKEITCEIDGKKLYLVHYPMKEDGSFRKHIKGASPEENKEMFSGIDADIYLYGHTHEFVDNKDSNKFYINPGALGCPGKTNDAPFGILDIDNNEIKYTQLKTSYDAQKVIKNIEEIAFPGYKRVLRVFYGQDAYQEDDNGKY